MGRLKSVAIFHHAENCMGGDEADPMPCCEDVSEEMKVSEVSTISFDFDAQPDLVEISGFEFVAYTIDFVDVVEGLDAFNLPPPPKIDYQSTYQVFLI